MAEDAPFWFIGEESGLVEFEGVVTFQSEGERVVVEIDGEAVEMSPRFATCFARACERGEHIVAKALGECALQAAHNAGLAASSFPDWDPPGS